MALSLAVTNVYSQTREETPTFNATLILERLTGKVLSSLGRKWLC